MKRILIPVLAAGLMTAVSCSDWTSLENLQYHKTPAELDPAGYENYLASIRAYKEDTHRLMLVTMLGTSQYPSKQNQHPVSMPDSADYILMKNADNLHENVVKEISEVFQKKGTKSLVYVDYAPITDEWNAIKDAAMEAGEATPTPDDARKFYAEKTAAQLELCNRYGFHGIVISYVGSPVGSEKAAAQEGFVASIEEWYASNQGKLMFMRGSIGNLKSENILNACMLYIVPGGETTSRVPLNSLVERAIGEKVPQDRVILELTVPSAAVPEQKGLTPKDAATKWLLPALGLDASGEPMQGSSTKTDFVPQGLCVENAQDDYFSKDLIYQRIRAGITAMAN